MKERISKILDNETRRLFTASEKTALHEKELKKLEILAKIFQLMQSTTMADKLPDEIRNASTDALLKALHTGSD